MRKLLLVFAVLFIGSLQLKAAYLLIPMDEDQKNHLKAYGITYWVLNNGGEAYWLLNYRGGSFAFKHNKIFEKECLTRDVSFKIIPDAQYNKSEQSSGMLLSPMPSTIVAIPVSKGDKVKAGDKLMVVEAMKMEHTITAPYDGTVSEIHFKIGEQADEGAELIIIDAEEST